MKKTASLSIALSFLLLQASVQADPLLEEPTVDFLISPVDVSVSRNYNGNYVGANVYTNTAPQQRLTRFLKKRGATKTYFRVENDEWDAFGDSHEMADPSNTIWWNLYDVTATDSGRKFRSKYVNLRNGENVTAEVTRGTRMNISTAYDLILLHKAYSTRRSRNKTLRKTFTLNAESAEKVPITNVLYTDTASALIKQKKSKK